MINDFNFINILTIKKSNHEKKSNYGFNFRIDAISNCIKNFCTGIRKSYNTDNDSTTFVSSILDPSKKYQITVGVTKESPLTYVMDIIIVKTNLNGDLRFTQKVSMPNTRENAYGIINDKNPANLNGYIISATSSRLSS